MTRPPPRSTLFPYTTLFRSVPIPDEAITQMRAHLDDIDFEADVVEIDRKSTRLNSSHMSISYAVFCLKKKQPQDHQCQPVSPRNVEHANCTGSSIREQCRQH